MTRKISAGRRARIFARDGNQCVLCGWKPADGPQTWNRRLKRWSLCLLEIDHIHPWSLGGTDEDHNLRVLCTPCNVRKGAHV